MIEQDYIMRLIKEMIRAVLKLLFNIDIESTTAEILQDKTAKAELDELLKLVELGNIDEAENKLFSELDKGNNEKLKLGLILYSHLNELEDDFLLENDFSRDEIKDGLKSVIDMYGLGSIADIYFE